MKLYFDWVCQPSRALYILLKVNHITFEEVVVSLKQGEHLHEGFKSVTRFQKLPCIVDDDGFQLSECIAMLRFFAAKGLPIADQFYPTNPRSRAAVDEYLEWQANNLRFGGAMYFKSQWMIPRMTKQQPVDPADDIYRSYMEQSLDTIENVWLANSKFIASNTISFADIIACCDIEQIRITSYDPFKNRPKLESLWKAVKELTNPFYDYAHADCYKMAKSSMKVPGK